MTAGIHSGAGCALTACPTTRMTSLSSILLVHFVSILGFAF
jgi:hypothetical protein